MGRMKFTWIHPDRVIQNNSASEALKRKRGLEIVHFFFEVMREMEEKNLSLDSTVVDYNPDQIDEDARSLLEDLQNPTFMGQAVRPGELPPEIQIEHRYENLRARYEMAKEQCRDMQPRSQGSQHSHNLPGGNGQRARLSNISQQNRKKEIPRKKMKVRSCNIRSINNLNSRNDPEDDGAAGGASAQQDLRVDSNSGFHQSACLGLITPTSQDARTNGNSSKKTKTKEKTGFYNSNNESEPANPNTRLGSPVAVSIAHKSRVPLNGNELESSWELPQTIDSSKAPTPSYLTGDSNLDAPTTLKGISKATLGTSSPFVMPTPAIPPALAHQHMMSSEDGLMLTYLNTKIDNREEAFPAQPEARAIRQKTQSLRLMYKGIHVLTWDINNKKLLSIEASIPEGCDITSVTSMKRRRSYEQKQEATASEKATLNSVVSHKWNKKQCLHIKSSRLSSAEDSDQTILLTPPPPDYPQLQNTVLFNYIGSPKLEMSRRPTQDMDLVGKVKNYPSPPTDKGLWKIWQ